MQLDCRIIIQGRGDPAYIESLKTYATKHPDKLSVQDKFDEQLAHQVYAGSDFFLMPSEFEPCGLSQLISFRYGTVPVVHKTGGLADTVKHKKTGVVFKPLNPVSLVRAVKQALRIYKQAPEFNALRKNAMKQTFSWPASARKYKEIYTCLLSA